MLKINIRNDSTLIEILVYDNEVTECNEGNEGFISASCCFNYHMLKKLSQKNINAFYDSLIPSLEACIQNVIERSNKINIEADKIPITNY